MYQNMGTFNAGVVGGNSGLNSSALAPGFTMDAAGVASGGAFLVSELEKRDPLIREPLTSVTYPRDINVNTGGGWVDYISAMSVEYGVTGGSTNGPVTAGGADAIPTVQANVDHGLYKAHVFAVAMRIMYVDMQRGNYVGRSIDRLLRDGVRMVYDKHMDANVYEGLATYGTTGLVNNPNAVRTSVAATGTGSATAWSTKTPQQILDDINTALTTTWAAADYDPSALPNHILLPYEQYSLILTTKVNDYDSETIMDFVLRNNVSSKNGGNLYIGPVAFCKGAGATNTDRMVVYVNHERFISVDELVPLTRIMTEPNAEHVCYDTAFMANISEVQLFYPQTLTYWDGI